MHNNFTDHIDDDEYIPKYMELVNFSPNLEPVGTHKKTALITGITGQDGSYLVDFLLTKEYKIVGLTRTTSGDEESKHKHLMKRCKDSKDITLFYSDLTDTGSLTKIISIVQPDEIYNLAAQSHVGLSFECPEYTCNIDAIGTLRLLEAIRICNMTNKVRFFQAFTSDLFEKPKELKPQNELTPFHPRSPYGCAKLFSYWIVRNYREAYNFYGVNGILFSHESHRRGQQFVTRKITMAVARIRKNVQTCLYLGNLDSKRDWGHAKDYVEAMWLMLQQDTPDDYCIATGEIHTVREFCEIAFKHAGITIEWKGDKGSLHEEGYDVEAKKVVVRIDPKFFRPVDNDFMYGDPSKAEKQLGWKRKISFDVLVKQMVEADIHKVQKELAKESKTHP